MNTIEESMRKKIKEFLTGWKETENDDMFGLEDSIRWMDEAVDILREIIGENDDCCEDDE